MDNFGDMLMMRKTPHARSNLAQRIIDASLIDRARKRSLGFFEELAMMFVLPKPAYVMGAAGVFALLIGLQFGDALSISSANDILFYGEFETGEWL